MLHKDNTSTMLLEVNAWASGSKRTRHMNIIYFLVADVAKRKHVTIEYCPTDEMIGDFVTKPFWGAKFRRFRNSIMNISHDEYGPVDVDALMTVHNEKVQKRLEAISQHMNEYWDEPTINKLSDIIADGNSQECVGDVIFTPNDKNISTQTY